jgi:hypothetical protein
MKPSINSYSEKIVEKKFDNNFLARNEHYQDKKEEMLKKLQQKEKEKY